MKYAMMTLKLSLAALSLCACTVVTGASKYETDPELEQQIKDDEAMSVQRSLDYDFVDMSPHGTETLDVALVNQDGIMQARARMVLPPVPLDENGSPQLDDYPTQTLFLEDALLPGPHRLFFFVDSNLNGSPDGESEQSSDFEHVWIKPVDPDGGGSFTHSFMFQRFKDGAFSAPGGTLSLNMPPQGGIVNAAVRDCIRDKLDDLFKDRLEVGVFLAGTETRQVAYFKFTKGNALPDQESIDLKGIIDAGNAYEIRTSLDGSIKKTVMRTAPQGGRPDIVIEPVDWFPFDTRLFATCFVGN